MGISSQTAQKQETRDKAMKEIEERLILEVLGNLGLVPLYKDVRRVVIKDLFPPEEKLTPEQKKRLKKIEEQKNRRRPQREKGGDRRTTKNRRPKRVRVNRR